MIHDSSSSGDESEEEFPRELIRNNSREQRPFSSFSTPSSTPRGSLVSGLNNLNTAPSPTPSLQSLQSELLEFQEREERKEILQLYVFVLRCISYPFNAKQPTDLARRQAKVSKLQLQTIRDRFAAFLDGNTRINSDEAFYNAVKAYFDIFICSERVLKLVVSGGCSANDFREVFKGIIEKRVRFLPEIHGLSKETVLSAWMAKFDSIYRGEDDHKRGSSRIAASAASELMLSKEQLYEMFQTILDIKKFEHQILYNACQLDNADEQAACIRRELQNKMRSIGELRKRLPPFLHKDMEKLFVEEQQKDINTLMQALESLPVSRSGASEKYSLYKYKK